MTDERMMVKIAEARGWRRWTFGDSLVKGLWLADKKFSGHKRRVVQLGLGWVILNCGGLTFTLEMLKNRFTPASHWVSPSGEIKFNPPNYPEDLNACHDMEEMLTNDQADEYEAHLERMNDGYSFCATAHQKCEAFLRTLNLWEEPTK